MMPLKSETGAYLGRLEIGQKVAHVIAAEVIGSSWVTLAGLALVHRAVRERNDLVARLEKYGFEIQKESPQLYNGPITNEFVERCRDRAYLQNFLAR